MKFISQLNEFYVPTLEIDHGKIVKNPEIPSRFEKVIEYMETNHEKISIKDYPLNYIYFVHPKWYVEHLKKLSEKAKDGEYLPEVFLKDRILDSGTPITFSTFDAAINAFYATLTGADELLKNKEHVYVLTRPPGHHATSNLAGGYCYFNNAAIAAKYIFSIIKERICILDLDFHHGNGTQSIFYEDPNIIYVSIHGSPELYFPWISGFEDEIGTGKASGTNFNFPLKGNITWKEYEPTLDKALEIISKFLPSVLIVSLGYDIHSDDHMGYFNLDGNAFKKIGEKLIAINIPILFVQEGGYNKEANFEAANNLFKNFERR